VVIGSVNGNSPYIGASNFSTSSNNGLSIKTNGVEQVRFTHVASAVNYISMKGSATGNAVEIAAAGTDTNRSINFSLGGSGNIRFNGSGILSARKTGWTPATGTATRTTFATFAGQDISATPTEAEVQAIDDHVKILSEHLKALIDDLHVTAGHGLIGT
jgi:hypothetical protein